MEELGWIVEHGETLQLLFIFGNASLFQTSVSESLLLRRFIFVARISRISRNALLYPVSNNESSLYTAKANSSIRSGENAGRLSICKANDIAFFIFL